MAEFGDVNTSQTETATNNELDQRHVNSMAGSSATDTSAVEKSLLALDSTTLVAVLAKVLTLKQLEALNQFYFAQPVENTSNTKAAHV